MLATLDDILHPLTASETPLLLTSADPYDLESYALNPMSLLRPVPKPDVTPLVEVFHHILPRLFVLLRPRSFCMTHRKYLYRTRDSGDARIWWCAGLEDATAICNASGAPKQRRRLAVYIVMSSRRSSFVARGTKTG